MIKRILLGMFSMAVVLGTANVSQAQYHHRHCCGSIINAFAGYASPVTAG